MPSSLFAKRILRPRTITSAIRTIQAASTITAVHKLHTSPTIKMSAQSGHPSTSPSDPSPNPTPNTTPPPHSMFYFPSMSTTLPLHSPSFRRVLFTGLYSQVVLMNIPVGGDIGEEVHTVDQALNFVAGKGRAIVAGKEQDVKAGDLVVVPAGTRHQFLNTGNERLVLYTIYSPAEHAPTTVHATKEEGDKAEDDGKDEAPAWARRTKKENESAGLVRLSGEY